MICDLCDKDQQSICERSFHFIKPINECLIRKSTMKIYNWTDQTGKVHKVPEGSCVLCKNHSDIFLDPFKGNEIYSCVCSINKEEEFDNRESIYDTFCSGYIFDEDDERISFLHEFIKA